MGLESIPEHWVQDRNTPWRHAIQGCPSSLMWLLACVWGGGRNLQNMLESITGSFLVNTIGKHYLLFRVDIKQTGNRNAPQRNESWIGHAKYWLIHIPQKETNKKLVKITKTSNTLMISRNLFEMTNTLASICAHLKSCIVMCSRQTTENMWENIRGQSYIPIKKRHFATKHV